MIGAMHVRLGPTRVGFKGLLQPFADVFKLLTKEVVVPSAANKVLFVVAPVVTLMPALAAWAVVPFGPEVVLANVNAGLLYIMAITSIGVYGVIVAGWASNSKYAFLGAARLGADGVVRAGHRLRAGQRAAGVGQPEHERNRAGGRAVAGSPSVA